MDESNPWSNSPDVRLNRWVPEEADILFLAGNDWESLPANYRTNWNKPVINLIQGFRHATPANPVFQHLKNKAIRIFAGEEVAAEVLNTGLVNGPSFTIPNGIDLNDLQQYAKKYVERETDLLIVGLKNPEIALKIAQSFDNLGIKLKCLTQQIPRNSFLKLLGNSKVTVFLPLQQEGFYLPALEGMALGTIVICPLFQGNQKLYRDGFNCLNPEYQSDAVMNAVKKALENSESEINQMLFHAQQSTFEHLIEREREQYLKILNSSLNLWTQNHG